MSQRGSSSPIVPIDEQSLDIVHPCTDYGFNRAFHDKKVASSFLNTILGFSGREAITDVHFLDKELPSRDNYGRDFVVDILCETGDGRRLLIEMKNDFRTDYATKAFTEFCRLMERWNAGVIRQEVVKESRKHACASTTSDGDKELWKDVKTSIVLVVSNKRTPHEQRKTLFPDHTVMEPDVINSYRMLHESVPGRPFGDLDARVVLVMLGNFNKTEAELISPLDQWLYAFKDESLADGVSRIPMYKHINDVRNVGVGTDPGLASFYSIMNKEVVRMAGHLESFERNISEINGIIEAMDEEYRLEGRLKARAETYRELAVDMIGEGESDSKILKYAKITAEELQAIKDSMES